MIRLELSKKGGQVVKALDFSGPELRIGRGLDCEIIVPDFAVALIEVVVRQDSNGNYRLLQNAAEFLCAKEVTLELGRYRLHVTNLDYFAAPPPAHVKGQRPEWIAPIFLSLVVLLFCVSGTFLLTTTKIEVRHDFEYILSILGFYVGVGLPLIFISRTLNGEFQFWSIFKYLSVALLILILVTVPMTGLRWLPGRLFEKSNLWIFFNVLLLLPLFWKLIQAVFQQLGRKTKIFILSLPVLFLLLREVVLYSPWQRQYFYEPSQPRPAVFSILESAAIPLTEFHQKMDSEIQ